MSIASESDLSLSLPMLKSSYQFGFQDASVVPQLIVGYNERSLAEEERGIQHERIITRTTQQTLQSQTVKSHSNQCCTSHAIIMLYDILSTNLFKPFDAHCCHMGTAIKHPMPDLIFDIQALRCSDLSVRVPRCQKLQMTA